MQRRDQVEEKPIMVYSTQKSPQGQRGIPKGIMCSCGVENVYMEYEGGKPENCGYCNLPLNPEQSRELKLNEINISR